MSVEKIIKTLTKDPSTQNMFILWPGLIPFTERFCYFVSPIMLALNDEPLIDYAIREAVIAYRNEKDERVRPRAYIQTMLDVSIETLNGLTVQGVKKKSIITWEPFVEPMYTWMVKHQISTIKTFRSLPNMSIAQMKMSLLVHLLPAQEIERLGLHSYK